MRRVIIILALSCACLVGCPGEPTGNPPAPQTLAIFHNNLGPMCIDAIEWLDIMQEQHPDLAVQEYLTTNPSNLVLLNQMRSEHGQSQGVSTTFEYLPIIFYRGQAFSGFNDQVRDALETLIVSADD